MKSWLRTDTYAKWLSEKMEKSLSIHLSPFRLPIFLGFSSFLSVPLSILALSACSWNSGGFCFPVCTSAKPGIVSKFGYVTWGKEIKPTSAHPFMVVGDETNVSTAVYGQLPIARAEYMKVHLDRTIQLPHYRCSFVFK